MAAEQKLDNTKIAEEASKLVAFMTYKQAKLAGDIFLEAYNEGKSKGQEGAELVLEISSRVYIAGYVQGVRQERKKESPVYRARYTGRE